MFDTSRPSAANTELVERGLMVAAVRVALTRRISVVEQLVVLFLLAGQSAVDRPLSGHTSHALFSPHSRQPPSNTQGCIQFATS